MYLRILLVLACALVVPSVASGQDWMKWEPTQQQTNNFSQPQPDKSEQSQPQAAPQETPVTDVQHSIEAPVALSRSTSPSMNKAECDAEVARTYPVNLWAPGLSQKRKELFAACMERRANPQQMMSASSSSNKKIECDAEVARTYPVNLWAPGLSKKRKELFAACMAR